MIKTNKFLIFIELILACTLVIDSFIKDIVEKNFITVSLGSLFLILVFFLKFEADNHRYNGDSIYMVIIFAAGYYIFIYLFGLLIGFYKNSNDLSFLNIFKNILQIGLFIVFSEMFRYMISIKGQRSKIVLVLLVLVLSLCDTSDLIYKCNFMDISDTVGLLGYYIIPSILQNIVLTYIAIKVGYKPTILYRFFFELPKYFLPIIPNTGLYLQTIINIIMPLFLFLWFHSMLKKSKPVVFNYKYKKTKIFLSIIIIIPIILGVALVSGLFKYYLVAVGSESMTPNIYKGDVVIVKKLDQNELKNLKTGDVLAYKNSGRTVVHRIKEIVILNENYYFYTKGDYNSFADSYSTKQNDVIGTITGKISWIGIPTVWLKELMNF